MPRLILMIIIVFSLFLGSVDAQDLRYGLTAPMGKTIIYEDVYNFYVMQYVPQITIRPQDVGRDELQKEQPPESTAKAYFAALAQGDYEWYLSLLSDDMRRQFNAEISEQSKTSDEVMKGLQDKYKSATIEFTHRVDRQSDSIIHCRVISHDGKIQAEQDLAINFRGQIINLSDDVIYNKWRFKGKTKRIKKMITRSSAAEGSNREQ